MENGTSHQNAACQYGGALYVERLVGGSSRARSTTTACMLSKDIPKTPEGWVGVSTLAAVQAWREVTPRPRLAAGGCSTLLAALVDPASHEIARPCIVVCDSDVHAAAV